ncbi:hypothetical protein O0Q50_19710 [Priestia aryabhattai]|uniref:Uncharacterized protein n=1 Tax=Priestia aryabhattai TaxID=412384 RepID=A0AAX6NBW4_PRIAR|nr:hypothetical protein [Priestia aryabhattai]MDU9693403.1 hypothetical protein [Priestia aryabhattai]
MPKIKKHIWMEQALKLNQTIKKEVDLWCIYSAKSLKFEDYVKKTKINFQESTVEEALKRYYKENEFFTNHSFLPAELEKSFNEITGRGLDIDIKYSYKEGIKFIPFHIGGNWTDKELQSLLRNGLEYYKNNAIEIAMRFGNSTEELYEKWLLGYFKQEIVQDPEIQNAFKARVQFFNEYIEHIATDNKTHRSTL